MRQLHPKLALSYFLEAHLMDPTDHETLIGIISTYVSIEMFDKALEYVEKVPNLILKNLFIIQCHLLANRTPPADLLKTFDFDVPNIDGVSDKDINSIYKQVRSLIMSNNGVSIDEILDYNNPQESDTSSYLTHVLQLLEIYQKNNDWEIVVTFLSRHIRTISCIKKTLCAISSTL